MNSATRQRGIAILTAVATAALVAALAVWIAWRQQLWLRQLENQYDMAEARGVAMAAIDLARLTLRDDVRRNHVDHLLEPWNVPIPAIPVERGQAGGRLVEQQGRFNLNNLVQNGQEQPGDIDACRRLFDSIGVSPDLVDALVDWQDSDAQVRYPGGAEDTDYLNLRPPYRTAGQPLTDLASLSALRGFDAETLARIAPYVTVLPQKTAVNVNFAEPEVLAAVLPALSLSEARAVVAARAGRFFETMEAFQAVLPESKRGELGLELVSVESRYFVNEVEVRFGRVNSRFAALLERNGEEVPRIVWMRRN
ncbi:type II secretion system minor pseudopilin GspK [Chitiniphilus purpureus]|uniref:Type II secretion system protein K n=1 Tax=Chitiniphilus purpureus TaxID=2981137 RepID=A0ABY6DJ21_9NEIS|nr:type II secretion system minor pseudopilin GspK [Chitiniphilus sp. CD1]UXY14359.1 type II secretion system minor pseudopilin GspK [Chitiniphilus sp. CD1]